jgi:Ras-related protein Rab-2A
MYASKDIVITLVGNKSDLDHKRVVQSSEGQEFAKEHDLLFVEASAKTAEGVEQAFMRTAQMVHAKLISGRLTGAEVSAEAFGPHARSSSLPLNLSLRLFTCICLFFGLCLNI